MPLFYQSPSVDYRPHPVCTALRALACIGAAFALFAIMAVALDLITARGYAVMKVAHITVPVLVVLPLLSGAGLWLLAEYLDYHTWLVLEKRRAAYPIYEDEHRGP